MICPNGTFHFHVWPSFKKRARRTRQKKEQEQSRDTVYIQEQSSTEETSILHYSPRPQQANCDTGTTSLGHRTDLHHSRLGHLPLEIRQHIYGYVFKREENCTVCSPSVTPAVPLVYTTTTSNGHSTASNHRSAAKKEEPPSQSYRTALLLTSHQTYIEAIDQLYRDNPFHLNHAHHFPSFTTPPFPTQLTRIRNLHICLSSTQCPLLAPWGPYTPSLMREWEILWTAVPGMPLLSKLDVNLEYKTHYRTWRECRPSCLAILSPLLLLRGLACFRLGFDVRWDITVRHEEQGLPPAIRSLCSRIEEVARCPRGNLLECIYLEACMVEGAGTFDDDDYDGGND